MAHRGGAGEEPENTLPAFARAVELGYTFLETDAHVSIDGVVFAFHDDVLDRVTDGTGRLSELLAARIEEADAGYAFSPDGGLSFPRRGQGITVPRLAGLLDAWPHVRVNIDAKSDEVVAPLVALIQRMNVHDRVCVGSFSDARLRRFRRLMSGRVCTSMGPRGISRARVASWVSGRVPRQGADALQIPPQAGRVTLAEPRLVRAAHRSGLQVHVWTIDEAPEMERLLDIGVDGIMTDRPALLREVLGRRGQWR
jgi:glycerophosphoryl diester phosphodiesterase